MSPSVFHDSTAGSILSTFCGSCHSCHEVKSIAGWLCPEVHTILLLPRRYALGFGGSDINTPFTAEHSTVPYTLCSDQL